MNTNYREQLKNKRVMVTGGSKGIGKSVASTFVELGAKVAVVARNERDLEDTVRELNSSGEGQAIGIRGDVSSISDIKKIMSRMDEEFRGIDVLVNSAGINNPKSVLEITEEDWDQIIDINLKGAFFLSQEAGKRMFEQKRGKIINLSSQMGHVGYYGRAAYCASKGGLELLNKVLAVELAPHVLVNTVAPTFIETPLTKDYFEDESFKKEVERNIPLNKIGKAEDVAGAILYLASDMSNLVTGTSLRVDGGWTAW
nr:SDR family NAD(P)-dependent oxidoreductase [Bacillus sp. FJAT-44742]